ncbi:J domain-containing protein [Oricola cellulosilytica]|uniref:Molecular chaperone DnaJ n=1 Tax=Oricola cellulosilytica TaxID=1429082 RepID=A0A4R0PCC6_9HYPH|nr:J domain-containing protein [Oricola cellulosilytica]TCD13744.1 molecular chaperone DnaJ [Oricola cellulosilytica]
MTTSSKYFDSIRINPGGKKRKRPQEEVSSQACQWAGCEKPGGHKAPAGRDREGQYFSFCIDHVREYNKNYNYFSGLSDKDVAKFQKDSLTGNRPTWKMGTAKSETTTSSAPVFSDLKSGSARSMRMRDPNWMARESIPKMRKLKPLEAKAMATLGLNASATGEDIKTQYKALVKKHHPDANGGDRTSEERFRDVVQAYQLLKTAGLC